ncbi:hypothetical protein A1e_00004 [Klebsiella phage VLCpiA1e]|nr:hypothetical protein A1f_00004 [Klebsiella phage VLCpiA1f]UVX31457.1 hypothetical protein A1e_00004 [Klebsiella phage VLCpiA1e]
MIKYDVYTRPNGLFYRVRVDSPLHSKAEVFVGQLDGWVKSGHKVGGILASPRSSLKARNVVFKDRLCSQ